jgi:hypothetical protein
MKLPIAFRTNVSKYTFAGEAQLINAYAEKQGTDAKDPLAVLPSYGLTLERAVTDTPQRGAIYLDDLDCIYTVHSTSVYKVTESGAATRIGVVPGNDIVQMSRNQATLPQISIHCDAGEFYIENDQVKQVTDEDLPTPVIGQDHVGGYTIYGLADRRFFLSSLNACQDIDGLDFATAEQSPDPLVRVKADGDLFLFKRKQIEQWRNTGNPDFPFEPIGTPIKHGLLSEQGVTNFDNTLLFAGDDSVVYRIAGTGAVQRVSDHSVERAIANEPDQASIMASSHTLEGHAFAVFSGSSFTRVYDAATAVWHSRESYNQGGSWRARFPVRAWGKTIVGDALTGNLYFLDKDSFVEGDQPLVWGMDTPTFHAFPNGAIMDALHIDVATGNALTTGQGSAPKMMLSWSVDGGATWKGNRLLSLGSYGERVRVTTRRLGRFGPAGVTFRFRISDPVIRSMIALDLQARPLKR